MAVLSSDETYVTVERGDTLWDIAERYLGSGTDYKQLAAINKIVDPDYIYVGQKIYLQPNLATDTAPTAFGKPEVTGFGVRADGEDNTLIAVWTWDKQNTASYKVMWSYHMGDGLWLASPSSIDVDPDSPLESQRCSFTIPNNAESVQFKVKPVSATFRRNDLEVEYWTAQWSDVKVYTDATPLKTPPTPIIEIDKYTLHARVNDVFMSEYGANQIEIQICQQPSINGERLYKQGWNPIGFENGKDGSEIYATWSYSCKVTPGYKYRVRVRGKDARDEKNIRYSDWTAYSDYVYTMPAAPEKITALNGTSETSVYLEWSKVDSATTYDIEYATEERYFNGSNATTIKTGIQENHYELTGLATGQTYYFRVRSVNDKGESAWCGSKQCILGEKPDAPTTWSDTTTAIVGDEVMLCWVHNSVDGSKQSRSEIEITIDGDTIVIYIDSDEKYSDMFGYSHPRDESTCYFYMYTSKYNEGCKIQWRVRTAGITNVVGDWSTLRTIDIYAPPTLSVSLKDKDNNAIAMVNSFPFTIDAFAGPNTQAPTGYHLSIISNRAYETLDNIGNTKIVNASDAVYSKYFDVSSNPLEVTFSAADVDLVNDGYYSIKMTVSMNSGLTAQSSLDFNVRWDSNIYEPNAEIAINTDNYTTNITPYCNWGSIEYYRAYKSNGLYYATLERLGYVWGTRIPGVYTEESNIIEVPKGTPIYEGVTEYGESVFYVKYQRISKVPNVYLSVYRREFDGSFTEIATDLDGARHTTVTDPHPALDYARYRIVATDKNTGTVSYYDMPGYPIGGSAVIIQWDETWSNFETSEEAALENPPWSGSLLKLPYNIDITDSSKPDTTLIEYAGRSHPICYYGTQIGQSATWSMAIEKDDEETLYALRRLSRWLGDVYVREPSGSGYWANINVSFSQKHREVVIPVTLEITRVEGGV